MLFDIMHIQTQILLTNLRRHKMNPQKTQFQHVPINGKCYTTASNNAIKISNYEIKSYPRKKIDMSGNTIHIPARIFKLRKNTSVILGNQ